MGDCVQSLAWSPDGNLLAAASIAGPIAWFEGATGKPVIQVKGHALGCGAIDWKSDGRYLASGGQDGCARIWDREGREAYRFQTDAGVWINMVAWEPGGDRLAFSAGRKLGTWLGGHGDPHFSDPQPSTLADLAWKPGGREIATACYGGVRLFQPGDSTPVREYAWKGSSLTVAWSPDGKCLAAGQQDNNVHFWRVETGQDMHMHGYATKVRELS